MAFLGQEEQLRDFQDRFRFLYLGLGIAFFLLLSRLVFLQILRGDQMRQFSEDNRIKRVKIEAPRGMILDRNRKLLVDNRPAFDLEVVPQYLRESKQADAVISTLAKIIRIPEADIREVLERAKGQPSFIPVKIKTDLTRDEVAEIESRKIDMPGVSVEQEIKRTHVHGEIGAHLLGYIGEVSAQELPRLNKNGLRYKLGDTTGKFGLEKEMEDVLRGLDGEKLVEVDALGRIKLSREKGSGFVVGAQNENTGQPGKNLVLTIDQDLQATAVEAFGDKIGSVVAVDPSTGQILAMISRPSFDPTEFSRGIPSAVWQKLLANDNHPLRDKTVQDHYPPGSTFKVITAIAGLEEGVIDERTTFRCTGTLKIGNRPFHCHLKHGHGEVNVVQAITKSCDIFFYRLSQKLESVDLIAKWAWHMGLGKKTGVPIAREVPGLIPTEEWKRKRFGQDWIEGETPLVAIGQSYLLTTAIQLANAYASVANGGILYRPYVVKAIETYDGQVLKEFTPEILDKTGLKPKTKELVLKGLWGVINQPGGTGYFQRLPGMDFVGKTGTVQVMRLSADKVFNKCESFRFKDRHNAMFAGFAPVDDPKIAVAVIGEHACHGASGAAPIARTIIKRYLEKHFPDQYGPEAVAKRLASIGQSPSVYVPKGARSEEDDIVANDDLSPVAPQAPAATQEIHSP